MRLWDLVEQRAEHFVIVDTFSHRKSDENYAKCKQKRESSPSSTNQHHHQQQRIPFDPLICNGTITAIHGSASFPRIEISRNIPTCEKFDQSDTKALAVFFTIVSALADKKFRNYSIFYNAKHCAHLDAPRSGSVGT